MFNMNPKSILKRALLNLGIEVKQIEKAPPIPRFFECSKQALLYSQGGKSATFACPVNLTMHNTGIGFCASGWNPFIETLKEFENNPKLEYKNSVLHDFYTGWTPKSAREAIIDFSDSPDIFASYHPLFLFLSPWTSLTYSEVEADVLWWNNKDNREHGCSHFNFPDDGWTFTGPVRLEKGMLEFNRTVCLYKKIRTEGYDRSKGGIGVTILKRGNDYRYLVGGGGYHRAIVMAALGFETFPARFHRNSIVDINDVGDWPHIRSGLWTEKQALNYVDHLFDVDSLSWANRMNLVHYNK